MTLLLDNMQLSFTYIYGTGHVGFSWSAQSGAFHLILLNAMHLQVLVVDIFVYEIVITFIKTLVDICDTYQFVKTFSVSAYWDLYTHCRLAKVVCLNTSTQISTTLWHIRSGCNAEQATLTCIRSFWQTHSSRKGRSSLTIRTSFRPIGKRRVKWATLEMSAHQFYLLFPKSNKRYVCETLYAHPVHENLLTEIFTNLTLWHWPLTSVTLQNLIWSCDICLVKIEKSTHVCIFIDFTSVYVNLWPWTLTSDHQT